MTTTSLYAYIKEIWKQNRIYYLTGIAILLVLKLFYRNADADALIWILAPTSRLVSSLSGIPFLWESHTGYVSHDLQFVIAASCSGVNFLMIAFAMLIFSFAHRISKFRWVGISIGISYLYTVLVNSLRILIAIYLPMVFDRQSLWSAQLTPDKLHTLIGIVVYFSALLLLYPLGDKLSRCFSHAPADGSDARMSPAYLAVLVPLFWYLGVVLGIPFLGRIIHGDFSQFRQYAGIVLTVCGCLCTILFLYHFLIAERQRR